MDNQSADLRKRIEATVNNKVAFSVKGRDLLVEAYLILDREERDENVIAEQRQQIAAAAQRDIQHVRRLAIAEAEIADLRQTIAAVESALKGERVEAR